MGQSIFRENKQHLQPTILEQQCQFPARKTSRAAGKLPVRGKFRMTCILIGSAAMANAPRIQCYLAAKQL